MDFDIGGIFKLLRHPCTVGRLDQLDRALDRALHPLFARGEIEARAIGEHQPAPLQRHGFGHHEDEPVTLDGGDHRQADRSEEHTSELQSLMRISYAVFCLKKKKMSMLKHRTTNK